MNARRAAFLILLAPAACRQIPVDTSAARLIPRDLAVEELRNVLAEATYVRCSAPLASLEGRQIREWAVDADGLEARAEGRPPIRAGFKALTATKLEQFGMVYRVLLFTEASAQSRGDFLRIHWSKAARASRALELIEALRQKP